MESVNPVLQDAGKRLLTIRQQINNLKAWNKSQENRLMEESPPHIDKSKSTERSILKPIHNTISNSFTKLEEQPLIPVHHNFEALLNAKLKENSENETPLASIQKRKFLKKGEGLSRYRMKPEDLKLKKSSNPSIKRSITLNNSNKPSHKDKSEPLQAFEILEERANDSSFCSTSSMVEQLMEESIKSTPIKCDFQTDKYLHIENEPDLNVIMKNYEFFGTRTLGVIDEEPSKIEDSSRDDEDPSKCDLVIINSNKNESEYSEDDHSDTECSSRCSCCQENRFMSASLSVYEETTTVYSPIKNTLQARLKELEIEIDAFRSENAYLSKLRSEYEGEYKKFCEEKTLILSKIREEHLAGLKELEEEKKKLQREKYAFDKYAKEMKNRPNKLEKEEIRLLKEEVQKMKEEMNKKEGRWAAAQARIRTEMKQLKDHNTKLKEELEKLRKPPKCVTFDRILKSQKSNSNILAKIDEELEKNRITADRIKTPTIPEDLNNTSGYNSDKSLESAKSIEQEEGDSKIVEQYDDIGNRVKLYPDGRKEIWYPNGNVKKISEDGKITKTIYYNGDVKEVRNDSKIVKYYYAENRSWQSKFEDGTEITEFPNGQVQKKFKDESIEINYPTGVIGHIDSDGNKKWVKPDGTVIIQQHGSDEKTIYMTNGETETHTSEYKKREYPDGTIKIVYTDGIHKTIYSNGRIRLKTRDGRLLSDSEVTS